MRGLVNYGICILGGVIVRAISGSTHIALALMIAMAVWLLTDVIIDRRPHRAAGH